MKLNVRIEEIEAEIDNNILVIRSKIPLKILSSAVLNGGLKEANGIINVQVSEGCGSDKNDVHWNAEDFLTKEARRLKFSNGKVVGLMTAAKMHNVVVNSAKYDETTLTVFVTAGSSVAVTAGDSTASRDNVKLEKIGTINIILLIDGNLTEGCMVDALKTVTEAKTVALRELDIRSLFSGDIASGTLTDSVAVGCTKKGVAIQYAGTFTMLGELIGKCVRKSVKSAIYKQEKLVSNRSLIKRLEERGISFDIIMSVLCDPKITCESLEYKQLQKQVKQLLSDRKIVALVVASLRLDDDLKKGLIPANTFNCVAQILFEEIVQSALRDYFSEDKDLLPFDSAKKEFAYKNKMGPLTKAVFIAILKKACSNIDI